MAFSKRMAAFLAAYEATGRICTAARAAGIQRGLHYRALKKDRVYAEAFEAADKRWGFRLQAIARRIAVKGWLEPVFQNGVLVGHKRKFSPSHIYKMLAAEMPEKYRERSEVDAKLGGAGGGPVSIEVVFVKPKSES